MLWLSKIVTLLAAIPWVRFARSLVKHWRVAMFCTLLLLLGIQTCRVNRMVEMAQAIDQTVSSSYIREGEVAKELPSVVNQSRQMAVTLPCHPLVVYQSKDQSAKTDQEATLPLNLTGLFLLEDRSNEYTLSTLISDQGNQSLRIEKTKSKFWRGPDALLTGLGFVQDQWGEKLTLKAEYIFAGVGPLEFQIEGKLSRYQNISHDLHLHLRESLASDVFYEIGAYALYRWK